MTGYGRSEFSLDQQRIQIELRAVNHRFFDARIRLPQRFSCAHGTIETALREHLGRGHVEVTITIDKGDTHTPQLNKKHIQNIWTQLRALRDELEPHATLSFDLLRFVPDLFIHEDSVDEKRINTAFAHATNDACAELTNMRKSEANRLLPELQQYLREIREAADTIKARRIHMAPETRKRLLDRIQELLGQHAHQFDDLRLEQEVALIVARGDVAEEISRLHSHVEQCENLLLSKSTLIGKKFDFLLQEIGREVNTIGSKAQDAEITTQVVTLKTMVERLREQAQNIV